MPDAALESRKRSRSNSTDGDGLVSDQHHHKRLNVGTDADHPRVEPVAAPAGNGEDTVMDAGDVVAATVGITSDIAMQDAANGADKDFKQMVHMRCLIMTQDASVIIGKGGAHIAEIRKKSGARVLVSEAVPGNPERILNISGQLEAVAKAFGLIARRMNDEPFDTTSGPTSRAVTIRLAIPHQRMGSVIGKGGVKIKEIQDQSGAQLKASEGMLPNSTERVLNIVGVADAIHIATYHVGTVLLEAQKVHGVTNNSLYRPAPPGMFPGGPGPNNGPPGPGPGPGQFNNRQGPGPGPNVGGPGFNGPGPGNFNGPYNAVGFPNGGQNMQGPGPQGMRPGPGMMGPVPMSPFNGGPMYPQGGFQQQRPQFMNAPAGPGAYGGGMGPQQPMVFGGGVMGGSIAPVTQEVTVPAEFIGPIIGKGGSKINELRQTSSCNIKVLDPAPGASTGQARRVTISGALPNVQMAVSLLNQRLTMERQKQQRNQAGGH